MTGEGRVSYARDTQVQTYYCALLYKPRLEIHYRSIKLGHLAVLVRSWELAVSIHAKKVKFTKV